MHIYNPAREFHAVQNAPHRQNSVRHFTLRKKDHWVTMLPNYLAPERAVPSHLADPGNAVYAQTLQPSYQLLP